MTRLEPRRSACHVAREGLLDREPGDGLAFHRVAVEQRRTRVSLNDQSELPRKIVRVVNSRVATEPAVGRHQVCGVAGDEDAFVLEFLRDVRGRVPAGVAIYPNREIRISHARANELNEPMLADVSGRIRGSLRIELRIAQRIDCEEASLRAAVQPEESTQHRIVHVDHAPGIVADPGRQIRGEVDGD